MFNSIEGLVLEKKVFLIMIVGLPSLHLPGEAGPEHPGFAGPLQH
jgi:hypothetical protein